MNENTAANTNIGSPVAATDGDSDALTYVLSGTDASSFNFDTGTGQIKTKAALDHETEDTCTVMVTVRDNRDAAGDADMMVDDTQAVTITVNDINDAPTFDTTPADFDVDENTETTETIQTYMASDVDAGGDTLTWSLDGTDKNDFSIGSSTGELKFASKPNFESPADGNTDNDYEVTI